MPRSTNADGSLTDESSPAPEYRTHTLRNRGAHMTTFGIAIPQGVGPAGFDGAATAAFVRRAEELGYASAWTSEGIVGDHPDLAPLELLSYAAACTSRIRLGCAVLVSSLASPLHLAKSITTVDQLSNGRLEIGVGAGGAFRNFAAFGVDKASFIAR